MWAPHIRPDNSSSLLKQLNDAFARIEADNNTPAQKIPLPPNHQVLSLCPDSVRRSLRRMAFLAVSLWLWRGAYRHPQHLAEPSCRPDVPQSHHHQLGPKEAVSLQLQRLPGCIHSHHREVLSAMMYHITSSLPSRLQSYQFADQSNRLTCDAPLLSYSALTTAVGLIYNNDETIYSCEVRRLRLS